MDINISQPYLQAHCQSHTSPSTDQSFVKKLAKPTQSKIELKKISSLLKIKNTQPHNPTQQRQ